MNVNDVFFKTLYESLAKEDTNEEDEKVCLISQEPLEDDFIKLDCGHRFNYKNLYHEVVMQKLKPSHNEVQRLRPSCIKCPYCREVQVGLLPQRSGYKVLYGVNKPEKYIMKRNKCEYVFLSGKRKGKRCNTACINNYCKRCSCLLKRRKQKALEKDLVNTVVKNAVDTYVDNERCNAILVSGKHKGERCKCKAKKNGMCGRHRNVKNNKK